MEEEEEADFCGKISYFESIALHETPVSWVILNPSHVFSNSIVAVLNTWHFNFCC